MSIPFTRELATRVANTRFDDVPPEAISVGRDLVIDAVACMLAGSIDRGTHIVRDFVRMSGTGPATVAGTTIKTSPAMAALANGTAAAILSYEDTNWHALGHPGGSLVPALLALAEDIGATGQAFLEAYVAGHEAMGKVGTAMAKGMYANGWHTTGVLGAFAAAAACSRLLGLDADKTASALGIAASGAGGLRSGMGTMTLGLHSGDAAAHGLMAAWLADRDFSGPTDAFEHTCGVAAAYVPGFSPDFASALTHWGRPWDLLDDSDGVGIKLIPAATTGFCAAECAMILAERHAIDPARVTAIEWRTTPLALEIARYGVPKTRNEAMFSTGWAIAMGLIDRRVGLTQFMTERLDDPLAKRLTGLARLAAHPEFRDLPSSDTAAGELTITLDDGRVLRHTRRRPRGYPGGEPWTRAQLQEKFLEAARCSLSQERASAALAELERLADLPDVRTLTRNLQP